MEALELHRTETAKLTEHQENCRLLGKDVGSVLLVTGIDYNLLL